MEIGRKIYGRMDRDLSKELHKEDLYYDAVNMRNMANKRQSTGAMATVRGTTLEKTIPDIAFEPQVDQLGNTVIRITYNGGALSLTGDQRSRVQNANPNQFQNLIPIGSCAGRDSIFYIATSEQGEPSSTSLGTIWEYNVKLNTMRLLFVDTMNISQKYPLEVYYNYESAIVEKLYFWGDINYVRHINVRATNLENRPLDFLDIAPLINPSSPYVENTLKGQGSFKPGCISWAYSYINVNGSESQISPESKLYSINVPDSGKPSTENVAISFQVKIENLRKDFDRIRIYRIHYTDAIAEPIITLIKEEFINDSTYTFTDDGREFVASYGLGQYLLLGTPPFKSTTGTLKNNRLFLLGNEYQDFTVDLDFRAYRFNQWGSVAEIFDANGNNILVTASNWLQIPKEHDAINKSTRAETDWNMSGNGVDNDDNYYDLYSYTTDGLRGAEGPYVIIRETTVKATAKVPERVPTELGIFARNSNEGFKNSKNFAHQGFKRDEIYRIGIVCYSGYGQRDFVSWICDYRISDHSQSKFTSGSDGFIRQVQLQATLKPEAKTLLKQQGVKGYQFVIVPRTNADKTIMCSGMIGPTAVSNKSSDKFGQIQNILAPYMAYWGKGDNSTFKQQPFGSGIAFQIESLFPINLAAWNRFIMEFRSIELDENTPTDGYFKLTNAQRISASSLYKKTYNTNNGNIVEVYSWINEVYKIPVQTDNLNEHFHFDSVLSIDTQNPEIRYDSYRPITVKPSSNILNFASAENVVGILVDQTTGASESIGSGCIYRTHPGKDMDVRLHNFLAFSTTNILDQVENRLVNYSDSGYFGYLMMADYKRLLPNQYGGSTYTARSRNKYIPASRYFDIDETPVPITGDIYRIEDMLFGDTFADLHHYMRSSLTYTDITTKSGIRGTYQYISESQIAEPLRVYASILTRKPSITFEDYYQYNDAYNRKADVRLFFARPLVLDTFQNYFNEIKASNVKTPGETQDSWLDFSEGNVGYLEGTYGKIVRALTGTQDEIHIWQENGFGIYAIEPSVSVSDSAGNETYLGKGGVLHSFTYLSKLNGLQQKWAIVSSPFGFIWYDQLRKAILALGAERKELQVDGVNSYVQNLPLMSDNANLSSSVLGGYSANTKESILFFIKSNSSEHEALVYNHLGGGWSHRLPGDPGIITDYYGTLFMNKRGTGQIYKFGEGLPGNMLGVQHPSSITVIISDKPGLVKILNNLFWNSEAYDSSNNQIHDFTFDKIRIWNDHQDTGVIDLNYPDLVRLFREWRYVVPDVGRLERLRSQYFFVSLICSNTNNYDLILQSLQYHYNVHSPAFM